MKIISSPAKLMKLENDKTPLRTTSPKFIKEAELIHKYLKPKTPKYLSELMEISQKLADENWQRNQIWKAKPSKKESSQAIYSFNGEVYKGLDVASLDEKAMEYLRKNFRMISGLYGLLRPSDNIMPYRLEMGRKFKFEKNKDLYSFWREKITNELKSELKKDEILLNVASNEYAKVLDKKKLENHLVNVEFKEIRNGKPKTIVVYTKHARGLLARFCAETNAKNLNDVKAFNTNKYLFDEKLSTKNNLVFIR
ncbi:peroxide stress protein YaaA [Halpernia sp.]|uniref:peroxide stress protein YaaA n=1 Tax=Halpernia sp. TaxID=2782209 RepID=UPI003A8F98E7